MKYYNIHASPTWHYTIYIVLVCTINIFYFNRLVTVCRLPLVYSQSGTIAYLPVKLTMSVDLPTPYMVYILQRNSRKQTGWKPETLRIISFIAKYIQRKNDTAKQMDDSTFKYTTLILRLRAFFRLIHVFGLVLWSRSSRAFRFQRINNYVLRVSLPRTVITTKRIASLSYYEFVNQI